MVPILKSHSCQQSPNMEAKSQLFNVKEPLNCGLYPLKWHLDYLILKVLKMCQELGLAFCSPQLSTQVSSLASKKRCHIGIFMSYLGSGKSKLACSEQLRLHGLVSSDLGLRTWDPVRTNPHKTIEHTHAKILESALKAQVSWGDTYIWWSHKSSM